MSFFRQLTEKPWLTPDGSVDNLPAGDTSFPPASKLGLKFFLVIVSVLFTLLLVAYSGRMSYEDWRPLPQQNLLFFNTAVLILSSVAMQTARNAARRGEFARVRWGLIAGGILAVVFLVGQIVAWRKLDGLPGFSITNPAIAFFYMITGLHALHLIGGLVAWGTTFIGLSKESEITDKIRLSTELCTVYWHFLLFIWLILFGLLFSGFDTLRYLPFIGGSH